MSASRRVSAILPLVVSVLLVAGPSRAHQFDTSKVRLVGAGSSAQFTIKDLSGCRANITAISLDPALVMVTPAFVPLSAEHAFTVTCLAEAKREVSILVSWTGEHAGGAGPCQEVASHVVTVCVEPTPRTSGGGSASGVLPDDPVNSSTGELWFREVPDLVLDGPLPMAFTRYYASRIDADGLTASPLGANWRHSYEWSLEDFGTQAEVLTPEGRRIEFRDDTPGLPRGGWTLHSPKDPAYQLVSTFNGHVLLDPTTRLMIEFEGGLAVGKLPATRILDGRGHELRLTHGPDGLQSVSDGSGRFLQLVYDGGRLAGVTDGERIVTFEHDGRLLAAVVDAVGKTWRYAYDGGHAMEGLLTSLTAPCGNERMRATWDAQGRVVSHVDGAGHEITLDYGAGVTTATLPGGATTAHHHDASGRLASVDDPGGTSWTTELDAAGRRTRVTDREGHAARVEWGAAGELLSATAVDGREVRLAWNERVLGNGLVMRDLARADWPDGTFETWTHDALGNVVAHVDRRGGEYALSHDAEGNVTEIRMPNGGTWTTTYGPGGLAASVENPEGEITTFERDALGRIVAITYPGGGRRTIARDGRDRITEWTDENGGTHRLSYDDNGNLARHESAAGRVTVFEHDGLERLVAVIAPNGARAERRHDALGRVTGLVDRAGAEWGLLLDALGTPVGMKDPAGNTWTRTVDGDGRVLTQQDPLGRTTAFETNENGFLRRATSPLGHAVEWEYDDAGKLAAVVSPSGVRDELAFDAENEAVRVSSGDGLATTSWERDVMGLVVARTDALGGTWRFTHDLAGRVDTLTDPLGAVTTRETDASASRVVTTFPGGLGTMTDVLDAAGALRTRAFSDGTTFTYERDADGFLVGATGLSLSLDGEGAVVASNGILVGRDAAGRVVSVEHAPGKVVTYALDVRGLPIEVTDWFGGTTRLEWDAAGQLVRIERPNGVVTEQAWDDDGRLAGITETGPAGRIASIAVERDGRARITSATRDLPLLPRLEASVLEAEVDEASRGTADEWDALGRVTRRGERRFAWNLADQLVSIEEPSGTTSFTYDAFGRLLTRRRDGEERGFRWNLGLEMAVPSVETRDGQDVAYHLWLPDGTLLCTIDAADGARRFHHFDEMGNTVFSTGDDGAVVAAWSYSPDGVLLESSGRDDLPFRWQGRLGQISEGRSLVLMRARWLDAERGGFLSRDPDPLSLSPLESTPYAYARGNPLGFVDPLGTNAEVIAAGIHTDVRVDVWCGDRIIGTLKLGFFAKSFKTGKPGGIAGWFGEGIASITAGAESVLLGNFTYGPPIDRPANEATSANVFVRGSRADDDRLVRKMLEWMGMSVGEGADIGRVIKDMFPNPKQERNRRFQINVNASETYGGYRVTTQVCNDFTDDALDVYYGFNWYQGWFWYGGTLIDQVRDHEKLLRDGVPTTSSVYFDLMPAVFGGW